MGNSGLPMGMYCLSLPLNSIPSCLSPTDGKYAIWRKLVREFVWCQHCGHADSSETGRANQLYCGTECTYDMYCGHHHLDSILTFSYHLRCIERAPLSPFQLHIYCLNLCRCCHVIVMEYFHSLNVFT